MMLDWLWTEIKPRFCKTSEKYFFGNSLKEQVKLPLKIEKWGWNYIGSRGYDESKIKSEKSLAEDLTMITLSK